MSNKEADFSYQFSCICCGECCTGNMKININLYDLYKIARYFAMNNTDELFQKRLVKLAQVQNGTWTPQIVFKTKPFSFCPWQINDLGDDGVLHGYCSLHPHDKPLVCKMAPVSRTVDLGDDDQSYYITAPTENCPGMKEDAVNRLEDLKRELKEELDYEYRFYRVLDQFAQEGERNIEEYRTLYEFGTDRNFEEILREREEYCQ